MIRASYLVWSSALAFALGVASPALAVPMKSCVASAGANRASCRANSAKAGFVDPRNLALAIAALPNVDDSASQKKKDVNDRLAADIRSIEDSTEQGQEAADPAFMRTLESKPVSLGSRIKRLRAGAATAAARAMVGDTVRTDTTINVVGRLASYGGTRAAAVQMGTLVSEHMALNAGVSKGFNRVHEAVGRVGITLGW